MEFFKQRENAELEINILAQNTKIQLFDIILNNRISELSMQKRSISIYPVKA